MPRHAGDFSPMHLYRGLVIASVLLALASAENLHGQDEAITLASVHGASATFTPTEGAWRWTNLVTPDAPEGGWPITERSVEIATPERDERLAAGWSLVEATPERVVFQQQLEAIGLRVRRIFSFGPASNALRIETWVRTEEDTNIVARIGLLDARIRGERFRETGTAPASFPLFGRSLFAGIEHVSGESHTAGDTVELLQRPRLTVDATWQLVAACVVGWPLPGHGSGLPRDARVREAFLHYLDSVRIKPERYVLHSETWWTLPPPLREQAVLNDIEALRKGFYERTGMFFDTYCLDLGWSDPRSFWKIEPQRFPNEFRSVNEKLNGLGARLGLWMSPGSGYPDGLSNAWLQAQGYELTPFEGLEPGAPCFALGGRYQREFRERIVSYAQQYGLGHVILDFMVQRCDVPTHGHPIGSESRYAIDAGVADVLDSLRAVTPNMALEPMVCGYPPSPWWLMKTPFVLGPAGDDVPMGRVPCPEWMESLISARDIAYRAGQEAWLMPTQALETWDLVVQTPGEFENTAVMAIGRGRWFVSSYIKPDLMKPEDWDFLAALMRWARGHKEFLGNAWMFGGQPEKRETYGFMFRNPAKDIYCVRNPWIEEGFIQLPAPAAGTPARDVRMIYPRRGTVARIEPGGKGPRIAVAAYETVMLETVPVDETRAVRTDSPGPEAALVGGARSSFAKSISTPSDDDRNVRYSWGGTVSLHGVHEAELSILVEGGLEVERAGCRVSLGGREVTARKVGSAGQFGAATDASPENWTWFIVPMPMGETTVQIEMTVPADEASIGVFLRGAVVADNDPAPDDGMPVFPVFKAERRAWSQTLVPLTTYPTEP
jgi:hypothetical protein